MIEEPYRWVEAIANRREYIESQLATGSPIAALSFREGILFLTLSRGRQKLFEIYDRVAMGATGHPGDIERLRMAAIDTASTEGFTRSAADVSLRRLAFFSLSPALKAAFEQIYGPPFLARLLFAEVAAEPEHDLFLRVDYDGGIISGGGDTLPARSSFGVVSGTKQSMESMEKFLLEKKLPATNLKQACQIALDTWCVGNLTLKDGESSERPAPEALAARRRQVLREAQLEVAVLERSKAQSIRYRVLGEDELRNFLPD